ncbi:extracellular solute-binding protein [Paenibacillus aceris]|uniref:Aldouronate transport system substrate-binding protein n=1 Tax=Paenibacillus aceris TaxID=869555 RepID=A0ABS4HX22_9BACL|nr:extracellular solute-binding protein [Paenibacillus aceris]MBP1963211.1 putative aldouronate transport system substrate-binding protein [Paenibacillus aceris]NHW38673.1 extracellular solute-binding protein [Paenibacillus aceris]
MKASKKVVGTLLVTTMISACSNQSDEGKSSPDGHGIPSINITMNSRSLPYVEASPNINEDIYVKRLEELSKTNVNIEIIPATDFDQKLNLLLAANEKLPDLLEISAINTKVSTPAINNGAFTELNDLIDKFGPNLKSNIPKEAWDSPTISKDGKIYAIPAMSGTTRNQVVFMRKDWLDKLGLQVPKTIDEYINVLTAFRDKDPNGNGKKDEIPFSGRKNLRVAEAFFGAYDVNPGEGISAGTWKYKDNKLVPKYILPEMKDALKIYQYLYKEKLLDNEVFVQEGKDWDAKIKGAARVGMWIHDPGYPDKWLAEVKKGEPTAEIINIPSPIGPDGKGGAEITSPIRSAYAIPASSKKAEDVIKFLNWFYSKEANTFLTYGIEGDDYTVNNGKIEYNYQTSADGINKENMHLMFLQITGEPYITNEEFMKGRPHGDLITNASKVANSEGRVNDGLDMPVPAIMLSQPELAKNGLFMETAAKIIVGQESIDYFDKFVADWKARGGNKAIDEATQWYQKNKK